MGSEQSQPATGAAGGAIRKSSATAGGTRSGPASQAGPSASSSSSRPFGAHNRPMSATAARLQRGNTIAVSGQTDGIGTAFAAGPAQTDSRPASPPMSVCSDSDLPYISYTDKPIGGEFKQRAMFVPARSVRLYCFNQPLYILLYPHTHTNRFAQTPQQRTVRVGIVVGRRRQSLRSPQLHVRNLHHQPIVWRQPRRQTATGVHVRRCQAGTATRTARRRHATHSGEFQPSVVCR